MAEYRVLLTGNPGTEDVMAEEAVEELRASRVVEVRSGKGRVVVEAPGPLDLLGDRLLSMRSIHSGILLLVEERVGPTLGDLERAAEAVARSELASYLPAGAAFAVRAERAGEGHEYTSMDIARLVGDAVIRACRERRGFRPEVRLNSPSVVVHASVVEDRFYAGILLTGERSRHRRRYRVYDHPAALKPTLAYVMLRLAGARDGDRIVDPMCGGGTVALEAAYLFEDSEITCMDKDPRHIHGARMNAVAARVEGRIRFLVGDARRMHEILGEASADVVVSNPPYGIRLGDPEAVRRLYRAFIPSLRLALAPGGRAALITTESDYMIELARRAGLRLAHVRRVRHGDLWASILVLERPT
ncbi:methyltransferase [Stetteria hydrogenophila]